MGLINVGAVGVTIVPETETFWSRFRSQTQPGAERAGNQIGQDLSRPIPRQLSQAVTRGLQANAAGQQGRRAGDNFADAFDRQVVTKIQAALRALPTNIRVDANTAPALAELQALRAALQLENAKIGLGVSPDEGTVARLAAIRAQLQAIGAASPDVRIRVNTGAASAELAAFAAQVEAASAALGDGGGGGGSGVGGLSGGGGSGGGLTRRMRMILGAIAFLGPALVPVGAVAVGALSAMGVAAGAAGAAIYGLVNGTNELATAAFNPAWNRFLDTLRELSKPAAGGLVEGLLNPMRQINAILPSFGDDFHRIGQDLGLIGGNVGLGVLAWARAFMPLTMQIGTGLALWSQGFANIGESQTFQSFVNYIRSEGPVVANTLAELGKAVVTILRAFEPWGSIILAGLDAFSTAINSVPLGTLQALTLVFEAWMTYKLLGGVLSGIAGGIARVAAASAVAVPSASRLSPALGAFAAGSGAAGLATAGLSALLITGLVVWQRHEAAVAASKNRIADYTNAVREDNGAIGENSRQLVINRLNTLNAFDAASKLGISQRILTEAATGNAAAMQVVEGAIKRVREANNAASTDANALTVANRSQGQAADALAAAVGEVNKEFGTGSEKAKQLQKQLSELMGSSEKVVIFKEAVSDLGRDMGIAADAAAKLASSLGFTDETVATQGRIDALKGLKLSLDNANTSQRSLIDAQLDYISSAGTAADKAKLMGATLKAANGDTLSYAGTIAAAAKSQQELVDTFSDGELQGQLKTFANSLHGVDFAQLSVTDAVKLFSQNAAPELTSQLSDIQDKAAAAAEATYLHEVATKGAKQASDDAAQAYQTLVNDSLSRLKTETGLTDQQVDDLRNSFLAMPPNVSTELEAIGLQTVNETLQNVALTFARLNGKEYTSYYNLVIDYTVGQQAFVDERNALFAGTPFAVGKADGGYISGPGTSTSDSIPARLSDGEYVLRASAVQALGVPLLDALNAAGSLPTPRKSDYMKPNTGYAAGGLVNVAPTISAGRGAGVYIENMNQVTDATGTAMAIDRQLNMLGG